MKNKEILYECSFCNNYYTFGEGYNPKTKQCKGCDDYDKEEPLRRLEREKQRQWWGKEGKYIEAYLRSRL